MLRALCPAILLLASLAHAESVPAAGPMAVTVKVHFDPAAAKALASAGELVILSGYFFGEPAPNATLKADEMDQIYLGGEEYTIWPVDQTVTFGQTLAKAPLDQVVEPYLNVNIYSARRTNPDNLLDCEIVDDSVKVLGAAEHVLNCKLIGS